VNIYIDESGSINNHVFNQPYFVIALVKVNDKKAVDKTFKRFISSNYDRLLELDKGKFDKNGNILREPNKMFQNGKFKELKGAQLDREMKSKFVESFSKCNGFELYYIRLTNSKLTDGFCKDISTAFNYPLKKALEYFIKKSYLPNEDCHLQLDERNEKTDKKYFLEQYINTEFSAKGVTSGNFKVTYFDSSHNKFIQIADVFANLYYSHLMTNNKYSKEFEILKATGLLKFIFKFPLDN